MREIILPLTQEFVCACKTKGST